jgi:ATP-binding cassette, subfamily F, member 3
MIQVHDLSKEFGSRLLFSNIDFSLNRNERIGLVGRNGTGKSTLLKIIKGDMQPDSGEVSTPQNYRIEMLSQHIQFSFETIIAECMSVLPKEYQDETYRAEKILSGLGFDKEDFLKNPLSFSGGYQIRLNLAKCLLQSPNLLLLDEPTNYLDIVSLKWLENFLRRYPGEVILITHDRSFMNNVCTHTMGIHRHKLVKVKGQYEHYWQKVQEAEALFENTRLNQEKKKKELEEFINKFRAKARQASLAQSRQKMLDKMEEFDKLEDISSIDFSFRYKDFFAKTLVEAQNLSFGYEENHPLFKQLSFHINKGDKIAIIGKNGRGKSTLLNIIAGKLTPKEGKIQSHPAVSFGLFGQTNINVLYPEHTIEQEITNANPDLTKTMVRNICGSMMFTGDDAEKKIQVLSGGEKSRVLLGKILATPSNLLLLDEPTNHLDQESIEILITELQKFPGAVVIVTHSETILERLPTKFIIFHHNTCEEFLGSYSDFLSKIGWAEEMESVAEFTTQNENKISHKEYTKQKAELLKEKTQKLKPLLKRIEQVENSISQQEEISEMAKGKLVLASENGQASDIQHYSKELAQAEEKIENYFFELEKLSEEQASVEIFFDTELAKLSTLK